MGRYPSHSKRPSPGTGTRIQCQSRFAGTKPRQFLHGLRSQQSNGAAVVQLLRGVPEQTLVPRDHYLRRPLARFDAKKPEFERKKLRIALRFRDVGIDAVDKGVDDPLSMRVIEVQLLLQVAPKPVQPGAGVALQLPASQDLRNRAGGLTSPNLELKKTLARRCILARRTDLPRSLHKYARFPSGL